MNHLRDTLSVKCPLPETRLRLAAYFVSLRKSSGVACMCLRVPMTSVNRALGAALSREVRIEAKPAGDHQGFDTLIGIAWEAEGAAILPKFQGALKVRSDVQSDRSFIELEGNYWPPLDGLGQVFDSAIDHQITES